MNKPLSPRQIAIIGRVPLPYGGVSVHLERLLSRLNSESIEYDFFDLGGKNDPKRRIFPGEKKLFWLLFFLLKARHRYRLIHFHSSNPYILLAANILMIGSGVRIAYSLHGERIFRWATKAGPWFLRWLLRKTLRRADHLFAINPNVAQKLPDLGIEPNRVTWMAAYLPPTRQELETFHLSSELCNFIETHSPLIGMQAWFGAFQDGQDIYSIDKVVPLLQELRTQFPNVGLCTVISGTLCPKHRKSIYELRKNSGIVDNWLLTEGESAAVTFFQRCALFFRPTISDGDSLSIRECLSFGVPVVASDAVVRPKGCVLYPTGDNNLMIKTIAKVFHSINDGTYKPLKSKDKDHALGLLEYYRRVLNKSACN